MKGFYEVEHAITLFCHTFILAPLQPDTTETVIHRKKKEYLMMCLRRAKSNEELKDCLPQSADTVSLSLTFSCGCVPLGCFGSTIACLLSKYKWKVFREKEKSASMCLAHNIAYLHDPDLLVNVILVDFTKYIRVYINSDMSNFPSPAKVCSQIRRKVFGAVEEVFEIMRLSDIHNIQIIPAVVCTCSEEYHFAELSTNLLCCSESKKTFKPSTKQLLWMGEDTNLQPELPTLLRLKIPEEVGINYNKFGTFLLNDEKGRLVLNIAACNHQHHENIVIDTLRRWLTSEPTPVTWDNLIKTLKLSGLSALASNVQKSIFNS